MAFFLKNSLGLAESLKASHRQSQPHHKQLLAVMAPTASSFPQVIIKANSPAVVDISHHKYVTHSKYVRTLTYVRTYFS